MNIQIILSQMLMLFAMMLVGYFVWKIGWFDESAYQKISKIVVNILNPLLMIYGVAGKEATGSASLILQNIGFVIFYYILLIIIGSILVAVLRPVKEERKLYRLMTLFPNVGFMGIPVITSIFGMESMIYVVFYMLGYNLLLYTYGIALARKAGVDAGANTGENAKAAEKGNGWTKILNAGVIASVAAVLIFWFQIKLPAAVVNFCDYMGNAVIPLSMMLIGMSIAKVDFKTIFTKPRIYGYTFIKTLLVPVIMAILLKKLPIDNVVFGVFILQLAMPVGSIVTLVAKENGADEITCTNGTVMTTLASILTIPIVCMFL